MKSRYRIKEVINNKNNTTKYYPQKRVLYYFYRYYNFQMKEDYFPKRVFYKEYNNAFKFIENRLVKIKENKPSKVVIQHQLYFNPKYK